MPLFDRDRDVLMSYDTDIAFEKGDLMLTEGSDFLVRKVFKLIISEIGDWKLDPQLYASPKAFTGQKNTRDTATRIQSYLKTNIQPHISPVECAVRVIPLNYDSVKVYIDLIFMGSTLASVPFTLDYVNGFKYTQFDARVDSVISSKNLKMNAPTDIQFPNPIKDRISRQ